MSPEISIEALGLTKEDIAERVIEQVCHNMLRSVDYHEDGEEEEVPSQFEVKLKERVKAQIDASIENIAGRHVIPNVTDYMEALVLQETNMYGEKKGEPVTFIEYLVQRAEAYIHEKVDMHGKTKAEDSYNWRGTQTRITYLIDKHLHYSISTAMENALSTANAAIMGGIKDAVEIKLKEVQDSLKVTVKTGR